MAARFIVRARPTHGPRSARLKTFENLISLFWNSEWDHLANFPCITKIKGWGLQQAGKSRTEERAWQEGSFKKFWIYSQRARGGCFSIKTMTWDSACQDCLPLPKAKSSNKRASLSKNVKEPRGTSGNLISKNEARSPHLSVVRESYESLQKETWRP